MTELLVSEAAEQAGTTAETVRYYERIGVIPPAARSDAGYRLYGEEDVDRLLFVKRWKHFGLRLQSIAELVEIRDRGLCPCGHAEELLETRLEELDEQLAQLNQLREDIRRVLGSAEVDAQRWPCESTVGGCAGGTNGETCGCTDETCGCTEEEHHD